MDKDNIKIFGSYKDLAIGFAELLCNKIGDLLTNKKIINIALSGGSTPIELFKILASDYQKKIKWKSINLYWVDERCVPPDSPESNYGNADKYLFSQINIPSSNIHYINGEVNPLKEAAIYSKIIMGNVTAKNSIPSFDIILLGVGEDGHTASIFPNQMGLLTSEKIYDVSFHPVTMQRRITMTGKIINNATVTYFLVIGENKSKIVNDILQESEDAKNYPAYYVNPLNGALFWVMDKKAGNEI